MGKFYVCKHCGNLVGIINNSGIPMICCDEPMNELVANTEDAAVEKHVPAVTVDGNRISVAVGEVDHPMTEEHFIQWIYLETEKGEQRKILNPNDVPKAVFTIEDDKAVAVYAYCNLHGLWKKDL